MIHIREIVNVIVKGLYNHLKLIPIPIEDLKPKEEYPYITYNLLNPYTPFEGQGNYNRKLIPSLDERYENDIEESIEVQPTVTLSINTYSKDKMEAIELAKEIMNWFKHIGYEYLDENNIVVVDVLAFGNRTVEIIDHYEQRIGMDVVIRFTDVIKRRYETIEELKINTEIE